MAKDNEEELELQQEEYQYSAPDSNETYVEEVQDQPAPVNRMGDDKRKRIVLILVIFGLLFVVFQFMNARNKNTKAAEPAVASPIEKAAQEKQMPVVSTPSEVSAEQPALATVSAPVAAAEPELSAKSAEQMQSLQTSVSSLENNIKSLTEKVDALKKQKRAVKASTVHRKPKPRLKIHSVQSEIKPLPMVYYIHAIVPRRAWLQSKNSEAMTVEIGDHVPGYGIIKSIDASEGIVTTQSNKVIRFNPN